MRTKVLIVTNSDEPNIASVMQYLRNPSQVVRLNADQLLETATVQYWQSERGDSFWRLIVDGKRITSDELAGIWYRRPEAPKAPKNTPVQFHEFVESEARHSLWNIWTTTTGCCWVNNPQALRLLELNKLYQMRIAAQVGLRVPRTLVTTETAAARTFYDALAGNVAIKTFGGLVGLTDNRGHRLGVYTSRITKEHLDTFAVGIAQAPVMFQEYIPKQLELRVTIVGRHIFACAIHSQDSKRTIDDWRRYDFENVRHEPYALDGAVSDKLLAFMRVLGLQFGAIDLIITPRQEVVFLEVNPSGQWAWIQSLTGLPISKTIAALLEHPEENTL